MTFSIISEKNSQSNLFMWRFMRASCFEWHNPLCHGVLIWNRRGVAVFISSRINMTAIFSQGRSLTRRRRCNTRRQNVTVMLASLKRAGWEREISASGFFLQPQRRFYWSFRSPRGKEMLYGCRIFCFSKTWKCLKLGPVPITIRTLAVSHGFTMRRFIISSHPQLPWQHYNSPATPQAL